MKRLVVAILVLSVLLTLVPVASVAASTGTITVVLKTDNSNGNFYLPHINKALIRVYGPSGYYRQQSFGGAEGVNPFYSYQCTFTNAPKGAYRITVQWYAGYDSAAREANQYGTLSWWESGDNYKFPSP